MTLSYQHQLIRQRHITGTDAPIIMGTRSFDRTPMDVWNEKLGRGKPVVENRRMRYGSHNETFALNEYLMETGIELKGTQAFVKHPDLAYVGGTVDAIAADRIIEIKNPDPDGKWRWGKSGSEEPDAYPEYYAYQIHHYMMCTGHPRGDLVAYFGGDDLRIYPIYRNEEMYEAMAELYAIFWEYVITQTEPERFLDETSLEDMKRRFPVSRAVEKTVNHEILQALETVREARDAKKRYAEAEDRAKAAILAFIEDADTLVTPAGETVATYKSGKPSTSFDKKRLAAAYPEIYEQFITHGEASRTLLLK